MADRDLVDELRHRQEAALDVLARGVAKLDAGPDALLAEAASLREELHTVLFAHQRFKHEHVYDPAVASGDEHRVAMARHMKIGCITAGELFQAHMRRWSIAAIVDDWDRYKVAARLTNNQLRRHIMTEAEGIAELMAAYA